MVDYQEMYYKMNRAMEKAMRILIEAQRECEEEYLKQTDGLSIRQRGFIIDVKGKEGQHPVSLCFGGCGGIMTPVIIPNCRSCSRLTPQPHDMA